MVRKKRSSAKVSNEETVSEVTTTPETVVETTPEPVVEPEPTPAPVAKPVGKRSRFSQLLGG